ncbi:MAG: shikimate dehydrogenase [Clostridia bacterium]|nr:shikimate dehydrogenase [Clostridia bacterium]
MTKLRLDVVGDPISHSKSPYIHETVLKELGFEYEYRKVQVKKGELSKYLFEAKALGLCGFNLTMPHKTDIIPFLDSIDDEALRLGSVNTVKIKDGKFFGYNTDALGMVYSMEQKGFGAKDKNIVILGAGGVALALALKMAFEGAGKITVLNRTLSSAENICEKVIKENGKNCTALPFEKESLQNAAKGCDILINCTPLGMEGIDADFEDLSFLDNLNQESLVFDLIYNPLETNLLKHAKELGLSTLNGLDMLIYQGLLADEIFLDTKLDLVSLKEKIDYVFKNLKNF